MAGPDVDFWAGMFARGTLPWDRGEANPALAGLLADGTLRIAAQAQLGWVDLEVADDGIGMSLYAKRLEKGRFIWPSAKDGVVSLTSPQLACLLDGIDWRNPQYSWRPTSAG